MSKTMLQLQKNEAIGVLAGGIAHDFNNILLPILGFAELLVEDLPKESDTGEYAGEILNGALRARSLVKQILSFSRRGEQEVRPIAPGKIMEEVTRLIRSTLPATITIRHEIHESTGHIMGNATQLHQVVWNLARNSRLYGEAEEGSTRIELRGGGGADTGGPWLEVADNGPGVAGESLAKIFEPFYTKGRGGTGLGLYLARELCEANQAHLGYRPSPGGGACFRISFADPERQKLLR